MRKTPPSTLTSLNNGLPTPPNSTPQPIPRLYNRSEEQT